MTSPHLLLVDDDADLGLIVGVLARKAGHQLTRCRDVPAAWEALRQVEPDLVLLDVNLPGESGLALLSRLRAEDSYVAELRVALFCQPRLSRDVAAGWALGADYLLAKDLVCDPPAWTRRLGEILAHARGQLEVSSVTFLRELRLPHAAPWVEALNRAGEEPQLRAAGAEVVEQLFRRALGHGFGRVADSWLEPATGRVASPGPSRGATPDQVQRVLSSFVEQVWCLLGPSASQSCADRLRQALGAADEQPPPGNDRP